MYSFQSFIYQIKILDVNELFGEDDLINKSDRSYDVVCDTLEGELIFISDIDFFHKIYKEEVSKSIN